MEEKKLPIVIIVAMDENNLIGKEGDLPWGRFKADLKRFKNLTEHHVLIVGRKTHEAILRKQQGPLRNRKTIVVSKKLVTLYLPPNCYAVSDPETALQLAQIIREDKSQEVFIAGGAEIYRLFLPRATRIYITRIHAAFEGDVYFPHWSMNNWTCTRYDKTYINEDIHAGYTFATLERKEKNDASVS